MLDATIYIKAINTAARTGDTDTLLALIDYCAKFGLNLDTLDRQGRVGLTLQRSGCEPYALDILIDGKDGWHYRETSNRRSRRWFDEVCDEGPWYYEEIEDPSQDSEERLEAMAQHWQERKNIERDYIELKPW